MNARATDVVVSAWTVATSAGVGADALAEAIYQNRSGLRACEFRPGPGAATVDLQTAIGEIDGLDRLALPAALSRFDCRNNRLAELALRADGFLERVAGIRMRYGAERIAVIVGTSTSGLLAAEQAYARRDADGRLPADFNYLETLNLAAVSDFVARRLALEGPRYCISTACSSGAKSFAAGARLLRLGLADAVIVGGCDSLTQTTLHGFGSLQLLAREACRPFDLERDGISIGEGAGFAVLERRAQAHDAQIGLAGWGESSDAHHMSSPHPDGLGAELAMRDALACAGLDAADIGYVNLHGTATRANDAAEGRAVARVLGPDCPSSSTKGIFGHLLGAAGAVEAIVTMRALLERRWPGTANLVRQDPACPNRVLAGPLAGDSRHAMSNAFGFGGNNCTLLFERL